ncbi:MAG: 1-acyl-sn-glycerol-3-phosphate acyltransferase, partial [Campylobacterota bacterium]|nr:1-acyl-sn-glycerol-3-phosphate acyltransferase [Campylobacterota bacterium]
MKKVKVVMRDNYPFATIYPNFEALKEANIINIESEIRWYGVELYNMEVDDVQKIHGYEIISDEIVVLEEPDDEVFRVLKSYISTLTQKKISLSSHIELDLGLDSLAYVELFIFVEKSFGVEIDEVIFSKIMTIKALYKYIKKRQKYINLTAVKWDEVLQEDIEEKLIYSPFIMFLYKIILFPLFKLYFRMEVIGTDNIPSSSCIIAPTHQSMLDGFIIEVTLPYKIVKNSFFLAYKQVFGTKLLKPMAKYGQGILIDANENLKHTMQYCALPLKEGNNLVIFPEGARTRDRKLLEFRVFFAMLSKTFSLPIVPVIVDG